MIPVRKHRLNAARARRGVAMLLVLIAVGVGTVLAAAALSSRDNSAAIGQNAGVLAEASWSAQSAADFAEAVLQTDADWRSMGESLVHGMSLAGGSVSVSVTDLEGNPPDADDRELILRATSTVQGVTSTVERRISLQPPAPLEQVFDPYLNEFAVFASTGLTVESGATIGRFAASPEAATLSPVRIGTGFSAVGGLSVAPGACFDGVGLYPDANSSAALQSAAATDASFAEGWAMPITVPAIAEPLPEEFVDLQADAAANPPADPAALSTADRFRAYLAIVMLASEEATLRESEGNLYGVESLAVRGGAVLRIEGNVRLHVRSALTVGVGGTIELAPGARLTVLLGGNLTVRDGGLGVDRAIGRDTTRTAASVSAYESPSRLWVMGVSPSSGGAANPIYTLRNNGVMLGTIHTPHASFVAETGASLIGRVTAATVTVRNTGALLYDPRMDSRRGFASRVSPMYNLAGDPIDGLTTTIATADTTESPKTLMGSLVTVVETTTDPLLRTSGIDATETTTVTKTLLSPLLTSDDCENSGSGSSGSGSSGSGSSGSGSSGSGSGELLGELLDPLLEDPEPEPEPLVTAESGPTPRDGTRLIAQQLPTRASDLED